MELFIIWLFFGLIGIAIGLKKALHPAIAFLGGLLLGPLSFLMIFLTPGEGSKKQCPQCAEWVQNAASVCRFCQHKFTAEEVNSIGGLSSRASYECPFCKGLIRGKASPCPHCNKPLTW